MSLKILYLRQGVFVAIRRDQDFRALRVPADQLKTFVESQLEHFKKYALEALGEDRASVLLTDDAEFSKWASHDLDFGLRPFIGLDEPTSFKMPDFATARDWQMQLRQNHLPEYEDPKNAFANSAKFGDFLVLKNLDFRSTACELEKGFAEFNRKKKILLHVCCGPDAAGVIHQLKSEFELVCFWYDPNIQPKAEHDKRLSAFLKVATIENAPAIVGEYDEDRFAASIAGLEHTPEQGAKCSVCYDLRLERAAREAKVQGCDLYATTLAISPHKVQQKLKAFGALYEKRLGVPYLARNFLKGDGFKRSVELTKEYDIYRQDYCGCYSSMHEGGPDARSRSTLVTISTTP